MIQQEMADQKFIQQEMTVFQRKYCSKRCLAKETKTEGAPICLSVYVPHKICPCTLPQK